MIVTVKSSSHSTTIDDAVVQKVLSFYPEEKLVTRRKFAAALTSGSIDFADLQKECGVVSLAWQLIFLSHAKLERELARIEANRNVCLSAKRIAKRRGNGGPSSRRILDRLIRLLNYTRAGTTLQPNSFCGALRGMTPVVAAEHIRSHFDIDLVAFRGKRKDAALQYLINKVQAKQVNVCQGVLTNKILPQFPEARTVYKTTSGFAIYDQHVPFVFLPSEVNPEERDGRQIYTLIYLVTVIGLDAYPFLIDKDFKARALASTGTEARIYDITSEFLLPSKETDKLRGQQITIEVRDRLATSFKMTPTAVVVTLRRRGVVGPREYKDLLPKEAPPRRSKQHVSSPKVMTSVSKFVGLYGMSAIKAGFGAGTLPAMRAQHLIFGGPNKKKFRELRKQL